MIKVLTTIGFIAGAAPISAQSYLCGGAEPFWSLELSPATGLFSTPERPPQSLEVALITQTKGRPWPKGYTLIGDNTTGIALIRARHCSDTMSDIEHAYEVEYLTQDGTLPVIFAGCCRLKPDQD